MPLNLNGLSMTGTSGLSLVGTSYMGTDGNLNVPNNAFLGARYVGNPIQSYGYPFPWNTTDVNQPGTPYYSAIFTCPSAGVYFVDLACIMQGAGSSAPGTIKYGYGGPTKNGSLWTFFCSYTNDYWGTIHHSCLIPCAAGDLLGYAINLAPSPSSIGNANATPGIYLDNHNYLTISLLG